MKTATFAGVVLSLVVATAPGSVQPAAACGCYGASSVEEAMAESTSVFAGQVVAIEEIKHDKSEQSDWKVLFEVQQSWKGASTPKVAITLPGRYRFFLNRFKLGTEHLIYATDDRSHAAASVDDAAWLTLDICTRTMPLANAADDVKELDASLWQSPQSGEVVRQALTRRFAQFLRVQKATAQSAEPQSSEAALSNMSKS